MNVEKVLKKKEKVEVIFENGKSLLISLDTFFEYPIVKGDFLDENKRKKIEDFEIKLGIKSKIIEFAKHKKRSDYEISLFLDKFSLDKCQKVEYKKMLEKYGMINDFELARIIIDNQLKKKNGINKIRLKLEERNIFTIDFRSMIDEQLYNENLDELKNKLLADNDSLSFLKKKEKIYRTLISKGYLHDECFVSSKYYDEEKEIEVALKQYKKLLADKKTKKSNISRKMSQMGFKYNIIEKIVKGEI